MEIGVSVGSAAPELVFVSVMETVTLPACVSSSGETEIVTWDEADEAEEATGRTEAAHKASKSIAMIFLMDLFKAYTPL